MVSSQQWLCTSIEICLRFYKNVVYLGSLVLENVIPEKTYFKCFSLQNFQ